MYFLDTDTFTHFFSGNPRIHYYRQKLSDPEICITIITRIEVLRGRFDFLLKGTSAEDLIRAQMLLNRTEEMVAEFPVVQLNQAAVDNFIRLRNFKGLRKRGRADLLIASITLAHGGTLVSRNLRDFAPIPLLKVVNWLD